jgi:hypothetical protein
MYSGDMYLLRSFVHDVVLHGITVTLSQYELYHTLYTHFYVNPTALYAMNLWEYRNISIFSVLIILNCSILLHCIDLTLHSTLLLSVFNVG